VPENPDWIHPLDAMSQREPLSKSAVRVIVMATEDAARAERIGDALVKLLHQRDRQASSIVVRADVYGWNRALEQGLSESLEPIVIVSSATEPWSAGHLDPLLKAIDSRDHVIGRRPRSKLAGSVRWLKAMPCRVLFAIPVGDLFSPIRIHRREKLAMIPFQSASRFLDVEILAKATFFVQTIEEVDVPKLDSPEVGPMGHDLATVFSHPVFKPDQEAESGGSGPAKHSERESEGHDGPGGENAQGDHDVNVE